MRGRGQCCRRGHVVYAAWASPFTATGISSVVGSINPAALGFRRILLSLFERQLKEAVAMKKIRCAVAMSLDSYIAGPNGEADWIVSGPRSEFRGAIRR